MKVLLLLMWHCNSVLGLSMSRCGQTLLVKHGLHAAPHVDRVIGPAWLPARPGIRVAHAKWQQEAALWQDR